MKNQLILINILLGLFSIQGYAADIKLHITTGFTPPVSDFYKTILDEIDKRLPNISISFEILPAERSLVLSNQAVTDGECCRIPEVVGIQYKNLLPLTESFFSVRFNLFEKKHNSTIKSFADLKPYSVGVVQGWKITVIKVEEVQPAEMHIVTTPEQLFKMLDQDRIDYGVVGYLSGLKTISSLKLNNIKAINPPLIEKPLYLMLHKKHKNLIPEFNKVIAEMNNDGTINRLYNQLLISIE